MIEPSTFDAIVVGTGLPESILASAIATAGKTVLHLDAYEGYLSPWASLSFSQFGLFAATSERLPKPRFSLSPETEELSGLPEDVKYSLLEVKEALPLYSSVKVSAFQEESALGRLNRYSLDLAGPKVVFCAGPLVDALINAQADHHVRFKAVEASFIWRDGEMTAVPASRADVFRDKTLSLSDKRFLMRFFKLVTDFTESEDGELAAGDLDRPFVELLRRQQLPISVQEIILYAIALVDDDQEQSSDAANLISTNDGLQSLRLYLTSASRFPDAPGAFLYPMYGHGDLPQAFCRCAAVRGALYVLRMPIVNLLLDEESGDSKGVKIASGQVLHSETVIASPTFCVEQRGAEESTLTTSSDLHADGSAHFRSSDEPSSSSGDYAIGGDSTRVARCLCITDQSLQPGLSSVLIIFPPSSLRGRKSKVVRVLQLGAASDVCPDGKFIVQLSMKCSDTTEAEETLQIVKDYLFRETDTDADTKPEKPKLLWSIFFIQEIPYSLQAMSGLKINGLKMCVMPDETIDYRSMMKHTEAIFHELYPEDEFFPKRPAISTSDHGDGDADD